MLVREGAETGKTPMEQRRRRWTLKHILVSVGLLVLALFFWGFTMEVSTPAMQAAMFAAVLTCCVGALWPHGGAALLLASFMALGMAGTVNTTNLWNVTAMLLGSAGAFLLFRSYLPLAWIASSIAFWGMAGASPWFMYIAMGLVFVGLVTSVALPFLVGKRGVGAEPLPHLADGPLMEVPERFFRFRSGNKLLKVALWLSGLTVLLGSIIWFAGLRVGGLTLMLVGMVLGFSFSVSVGFGSRMHYRVDPKGIHALKFLREKSIPWTQVCGLFLRYQILLGVSQGWVYYCILSPGKVIAFPHTLEGATELRDLIEKATGLRWPEPEGG